MSQIQPRKDKGRPEGGQWADRHRDEDTVNLTQDQLVPLTPAAAAVVDALTRAGGRPLIVGGTVRDALLARRDGFPVESKDVDIEVHGLDSHEQLLRALRPLGPVDERGVSFGVVAARVDGEDFDVSLPRRESKSGVGHQGFDIEVDPTMPERDAFARRDFTLNALGWDPATGQLIDHFGGVADLEAGVLRHTSDAFSDDPLRVLRAVQFSARFGFTVAPETLELSRSIVDGFHELSTERVWGEWSKIARRGRSVSQAMSVLSDTGWLRHFPALADTQGCEQDPGWHPEGDVFTHQGLAADHAAHAADAAGLDPERREIVVLAALLHDVGKPETTVHSHDGRISSSGHAGAGEPLAREFLAGIGASRTVQDQVGPIVAEHMACVASSSQREKPTATAVRRLIRRLDRDGTGPDIKVWAAVVDADCAGRGAGEKASPASAWLEVAEHVGPTPRKALLLGAHIAEAGYQPGPGWAAVIAAAVEAQDEGVFDDEEGARTWFLRSGLVPVGYPARPSNRQQSQTQKWLRLNGR